MKRCACRRGCSGPARLRPANSWTRTVLAERATLTLHERAILVCATAARTGDSYCSLAWGTTLAEESDPETAATVLLRQGAPAPSARENALARSAGQVARDANAITTRDADQLRAVGMSDAEIFDATMFVALRLAICVVNDALGARPDARLAAAAPAAVRNAVI